MIRNFVLTRLALSLAVASLIAVPGWAMIVGAGSIPMQSWQCVGGGSTYRYTHVTIGQTWHSQGSNCYKEVWLSWDSPDGTGWTHYPSPQTGYSTPQSQSVPYGVAAWSYHFFRENWGPGQNGWTCTWTSGSC